MLESPKELLRVLRVFAAEFAALFLPVPHSCNPALSRDDKGLEAVPETDE